MTGTLFDVQRFSVHDGAGIRTTVFMKGCPLRCAWCQNPEGLSRDVALWNFDNLCVGCGACLAACPAGALAPGPGGRPRVDPDACVGCGGCVDACPGNAMAFDGFVVEADELAARLLADRVFFDASGGGVTFSGGEPLAQAEFVLSVAARLRADGIATAVETSMACPWDALERAAEWIDGFIVDLKLADPERHLAATGLDNAGVLDNFARLGALLAGRGRLKVRIPLIPGYTDDAGNLSALGEIIAGNADGVPVELMNFNPLAAAKYRRMGRDGGWWDGVRPFGRAEMAEKEALVRKAMRR